VGPVRWTIVLRDVLLLASLGTATIAGMTRSEPLRMNCGNAVLVGERWTGAGPIMVLLHAGVTDRRSWDKVIQQLPSEVGVIVYDRRGFGDTGPSQGAFSHVEDLLAVLDHATNGPVWLVGSSMGGGVALDTALTAPERVEGLVLLAPAVSGAPEFDLDPDTARIGGLVERAEQTGDLEDVNRLETWLWLDGSGQPEGRVGDPARALPREMNAVLLANAAPEDAGASGVDAFWTRCRCPPSWPAASSTFRSWSNAAACWLSASPVPDTGRSAA